MPTGPDEPDPLPAASAAAAGRAPDLGASPALAEPLPLPLPPAHDTLHGAFGLLRQDLMRRFALREEAPTLWRLLCALPQPGVIAVVLYRLATWRQARGSRLQVKLIELVMYYLCHVEIHAGSVIGPGLVVPDNGGVGIPRFARIGRNCTFLGSALLTVGGLEGIDLATARIVLGDHCVIGHRARIVGALTLGDGTQIKENSMVMTSFPQPGQLLSGISARRRATLPLALVRAWNPLRHRPLSGSPGDPA